MHDINPAVKLSLLPKYITLYVRYLNTEQNSCYCSLTSIYPTGEDQGQDVPALLDVVLLLTAPQALLTHSPRYWDDLLLEGLAVEPVLHPRRLFEEQLTQKTVENWEAGYRLKNIQSTVKNIKSVDRSHLKSSYIPNRKNKLICFNIIFLIHEYYMTCYINWMMLFWLYTSILSIYMYLAKLFQQSVYHRCLEQWNKATNYTYQMTRVTVI